MNKIILIGAGGHARSCIDVIELLGYYEIAGLVEKDERKRKENLGYPILGIDDDLQDLRQKYSHALVTLGQIKSPATRIRLFCQLQDLDYHLPYIISPSAYLSKHAQIGDGTIVMHDSIVNASARIGKNCIINNKALIEHDVIIGDNCHIATGAIINGEVTIGNGTFIGSGTVTKEFISIGNNCVIGAGAILKSNIKSNQIIKN